MEVYLKAEEPKLVGWLGGRYAPFDHKHDQIKVTITHEDSFDTIVLPLTRRQRNFDHALVIHDPRLIEKNVPLGAERQYDDYKNVDRFTWRALILDMDQFEILFDLPEFEAFEKGPDVDAETGAAVDPRDYRRIGKETYSGMRATGLWVDEVSAMPSWFVPKESWFVPKEVEEFAGTYGTKSAVWETAARPSLDWATAVEPMLKISADAIKEGRITATTLRAEDVADTYRYLNAHLEIDRDIVKKFTAEMQTRIDREFLFGSAATSAFINPKVTP